MKNTECYPEFRVLDFRILNTLIFDISGNWGFHKAICFYNYLVVNKKKHVNFSWYNGYIQCPEDKHVNCLYNFFYSYVQVATERKLYENIV
jgi:hypothetical protein